MRRLALATLIPLGLLLALPLAGAGLAGRPLAPFLEFPPLTRRILPPPFSALAFAAAAALSAACLALPAARILQSLRSAPSGPPSAPRRFPGWGWAALFGLAAAWYLAWTRHPWMAAFQAHTFTPVWLAYIFVANALCLRNTGRSPLTHRPGFFWALFPASASFWWVFEYLNRFVQNWYYEGPALGPWPYFGWASLCFSTVLPAVVSTRDWVASWKWLKRAFGNVKPIEGFRHPGLPWLLGGGAAAGLAGIGSWPHLLFPLLWVAPLLLLAAGRSLAGLRQPLAGFRSRDWTGLAAVMLAALICGLLWELWNFHSLAKWKYAIPYVHRFEIFEMPLLGYAGYLPFGLECALAADLVEDWMNVPQSAHPAGWDPASRKPP
jgi:hypothetical protein